MQLSELRSFLREHLLERVMPFWIDCALDPDGGINTCIADDGTWLNRDKWLWSQWRAVWVFCKLYNCVEPRQQWLDAARQIAEFSLHHGWDETAPGWRLCVTHDGRQLKGCESIYVDAFAVYGLQELWRTTGNARDLAWARKTAEHALQRLQMPHDRIPHFPYPVPVGARVHGLPMMFSLVLWELGQAAEEAKYCDAALAMADEVMHQFYRVDRDLLLERIAAHGTEYPPPLGTVVIPGHVLESMWFQIHIARDCGDTARIEACCRLILRHFELGWDPQFGGIFHAVDAESGAEVGWGFPDAKLWWPQVEAMYALLLAYEQTRDATFLEAYWQVHGFAFANYPVAECGEWRQKLDRQGRPFEGTPSLPVKDPFHLPRALIYCVEVLDRLISGRAYQSQNSLGRISA